MPQMLQALSTVRGNLRTELNGQSDGTEGENRHEEKDLTDLTAIYASLRWQHAHTSPLLRNGELIR